MHPRHLVPLAATLGALAAAPAHAADPSFFFTDTSYRSAADIPVGFYAGGSPAFLEDFEDGSLGGSLGASAGSVIGPGSADGFRDGVDGDDGAVDGACGPQSLKCSDWFSGSGSAGVTFTYTGAALPTAFGAVWTDGGGAVTFRAFDANGALIGEITRDGFADGSFSGTVGEDRFFGVTYADGIKSISISNSSGGIEIDHVQYGSMVSSVPEPPAWAMLAAGGLLALRRVRRSSR